MFYSGKSLASCLNGEAECFSVFLSDLNGAFFLCLILSVLVIGGRFFLIKEESSPESKSSYTYGIDSFIALLIAFITTLCWGVINFSEIRGLYYGESLESPYWVMGSYLALIISGGVSLILITRIFTKSENSTTVEDKES